MGIFSKILRSGVVGTGSLPVYDDFWYGVAGKPSIAGVQVNEESALKYLTVFACVSLISGDIARLPLILYKRAKDGSKQRVLNHPLYDILHNAPNPSTTSFNFREAAQNHLLLWGNTYARIKKTGIGGAIKSLEQIPVPGRVQIKTDRRGIYYEWSDGKGKHRAAKKDVLHIPGFGFNGLTGMSLIGLAREAIGLGMATEQFGSMYFGKGTHPAGIYEMDGYLGDNKTEFLKTLKTGIAGLGNSHQIMVAEGGAKYKPLTIPLNDAQFLETRKFQKLELCGMFHVPPHKIAIHDQNSNHNNLEQENSGYVDSCLMHWIVRWEQNISLQLLTREERMQGYFAEFLVDGLLRGDSQARGEFYNKMFQVGALSPNKILAKENMNPIDGGDQHFVQLNMVPLNMAGEIVKDNNQPKKEDKASREYRSKNSIITRDRISKQYYPLFHRAAQDIVNKEGLAVKGQINKQRKLRTDGNMQKWLDDFYRKMPKEIKSKIGPVIRSFSEAIQAAAADEMGTDVEISKDLERFIDDYTTRYAERHTESSLGQLTALLEQDLTALEERVDEWAKTRADKIAVNETVRASSAIYQAVAFSVGFSTVLRNRGPKTCPYCRSLAGKKVRAGGGPLVSDGEELPGKNSTDPPMKIRGDKFHTPIHQGCDCYMSIG